MERDYKKLDPEMLQHLKKEYIKPEQLPKELLEKVSGGITVDDFDEYQETDYRCPRCNNPVLKLGFINGQCIGFFHECGYIEIF